MPDRDFLRLSDRFVQKVLRELDVEDIAWFLIDAPEEVRDVILRNFSQRSLTLFNQTSTLLNPDNAERKGEGRQRVLRVLGIMIENSDIILSKTEP